MTFDSSASANMIQILANMPDFMREQIVRKKLQEFFLFTESDKCETVRTALKAASSIEVQKLTVLLKTWMAVLSEFDTSAIVLMLRLYCEEISKDRSAVEKLNMNCMIRAFNALDEAKKQKFIDCLKESMLSVPNWHKIIRIMPKAAIEILKMK